MYLTNLQPCVPIVYHQRDSKSLEKFGTNITAEWKPDSSKIVIAVSEFLSKTHLNYHFFYLDLRRPSDFLQIKRNFKSKRALHPD